MWCPRNWSTLHTCYLPSLIPHTTPKQKVRGSLICLAKIKDEKLFFILKASSHYYLGAQKNVQHKIIDEININQYYYYALMEGIVTQLTKVYEYLT